MRARVETLLARNMPARLGVSSYWLSSDRLDDIDAAQRALAVGVAEQDDAGAEGAALELRTAIQSLEDHAFWQRIEQRIEKARRHV